MHQVLFVPVNRSPTKHNTFRDSSGTLLRCLEDTVIKGLNISHGERDRGEVSGFENAMAKCSGIREESEEKWLRHLEFTAKTKFVTYSSHQIRMAHCGYLVIITDRHLQSRHGDKYN